MASSAPAATLLDSLPARPPTPPREASHDAEAPAKLLLSRTSSLDPRLSLQTPPSVNSLASSVATSSNPSSSRARKKVEWSSHTEYNDAPKYIGGGKVGKSSPASAPSSASSKPVKGILKPSSSPNPLASSLSSELDGPSNQANMTEMLDSTIKQLAGADRDSRLDAYMMLARALKASNNLPDRVALQDKMSLFMQFIQRDVTSKNASGGLDSSLTNHALSLLATFLHFPAIASTLTSEFGVFLIDHSIRCFEDASTPKDVARHFMQVVAFQNFSAKVMTSDRVGRLVSALHRIEDHLKGKSIIMSRLQIYKRLIKQTRIHMAVHSDWLKDMFTDMLSTLKDIRAAAINLGTEAGFALRSEKLLMRKANEILQTTDEEGEAYIDFYIQRLSAMVKDKQFLAAVPQIWSVVILYMRCPLERWQYYSPWLTLVQFSFNTTDGQTKQEANYAWNRYVYLSLLDGKVTERMLKTLCQPFFSQLGRKVSTKQSEEAMKLRRAVIGGACTLYYYTFRPGNAKASPDLTWDVAVQPVMSQLIGLDGKREMPADCLTHACRMLVGLLDVSTPRVWREDRIMDLPPVKADELPSIDSKWVRRNCDKVFQAVGPILEKKFTDLANKESLTYRLWQVLVGSVTAASAKDIKVSEDTAKFFACTFGLLSKIWSQGCPDSDSLNARFLSSVQNFVTLLVEGLGMLPFTEKRLSMIMGNTFEPVATPSHRPDRPEKPRGTIRTPLHHLFSMLCSVPPGVADDEDFSEFLQSVFEPFLSGKGVKSRGEVVREMLQLLPRNILCPFAPWVLAARSARSTLESGKTASTSPSGNDKILGPEYREIVSLLERGLTSHPNLPSHHWFALFDLISEHVIQEFGDAGRAIIVIEPLAKVLVESFGSSAKPSSMSLVAAKTLFEVAKLPRDRQALDVARRRLWGAPATVGRAGPSDPFDNLYKLGTHGLQLLYDRLDDFDLAAETTPLVEAVGAFMTKSYSHSVIATLSKTQAGICPWIQDERAQLHLSDESPLSRALRLVWNRICVELVGHGRLDKEQLDQIEPLLTAAFKSKHRFIVNKAADTWNMIIQYEDHVECSDSFMSVLSSMRSKVDLSLPGVEEPSGDFGAQATSFIESQDDLSFVALSSTSSHRDAPRPLVPVVANTLVMSKPALSKKRRRDATPETRGKSKRTSTPRLRHDNSQIQFAPIASSSPLIDESQHLTERQREVRERQRENAALYSDVRSSSPGLPAQKSSPDVAQESPVANNGRQQKTTPERPTSYEDLISSTPTPRRGQVLQIDDYNDPPSSPPEPRPYPLLSEIQSRSRASSSLENWEFSSPPGSPVTSRQQVAHDAEPPHLVLTDDSTQHKAALSTSEQALAMEDVPGSMEVIPSSVIPAEFSTARETRDAVIGAQEPPSTPPQAPATELHAASKSAGDDLMDARSSPPVDETAAGEALPEMKDTSFALSEVDESGLIKFVVELETRTCDLPLTKATPSADKQSTVGSAAQDCITVSSSPPRRSRRTSKRSGSPMVPSTPDEAAEVAEAEPTIRKRKRGGAKQIDGRRKKRRSSEPEEAQPVDNGSQGTSPSALRLPRRSLGVKRRRSARTARAGRAISEASQLEDVKPAMSDDHVGDTDEELMSQLVTESNAASQSHSPPYEGVAEEPAEIPDSMDPGSINDKAAGSIQPRGGHDDSGDRVEDQGQDGAATIMEKLRGGLDGLRQASSLSREEVYKIEDMLMDMKRELFAAESRGRQSV